MKKEPIQVTFREDPSVLSVSYSDTPGDGNYILHAQVEPLRKALNARRKEQKAAKQAGRRFYASKSNGGFWYIRDRNNNGNAAGSIEDIAGAAIYAKALARIMNRETEKVVDENPF